jgi:transposase InsO family protein
VGDFTYIATGEGWLFLAVVIDLFSRKVVGWSMRPDMQRNLVIGALEMAWFARNPSQRAGRIFHSDRGSQYASEDFGKVLKEHGITPSMSRKGNCWDNACSETLFSSLKVERLHGEQFETIRQATVPDFVHNLVQANTKKLQVPATVLPVLLKICALRAP